MANSAIASAKSDQVEGVNMELSARSARGLVITLTLLALIVGHAGRGEAAQDGASDAAAAAVEAVGAQPAAANDLAVLPSSHGAVASVGEPGAALTLAVEAGPRVDGATGSVSQTFEGAATDTLATIESTEDGLRVLHHLESADAPVELEVTMGGDVTS